MDSAAEAAVAVKAVSQARARRRRQEAVRGVIRPGRRFRSRRVSRSTSSPPRGIGDEATVLHASFDTRVGPFEAVLVFMARAARRARSTRQAPKGKVVPDDILALARTMAQEDGGAAVELGSSTLAWRMPGGAEWLERLPRLIDGVRGAVATRAGPPIVRRQLLVRRARRRHGVEDRLATTRSRSTRRSLFASWDGDGAVRAARPRTPSAMRCSSSAASRGRPCSSSMTTRRATSSPVSCRGSGSRRLRAPAARGHCRCAGSTSCPAYGMRSAARSSARCSTLPSAHSASSARRRDHSCSRTRTSTPATSCAARREPWLVIDPKPIAAEREFTPVAMIRDRKEEVLAGPRPADAAAAAARPPVSSDLELDRERVRGWTIAHTVAWGFEKHAAPLTHAEMARLLLEA